MNDKQIKQENRPPNGLQSSPAIKDGQFSVIATDWITT